MGITRKTLQEWAKKYRDIGDTLKRDKEVADIEVENTLFALAKAGNITAIIFWLKNRKPKDWRDKPTAETEDIMKKLDSVLGGIDAKANE